MMGILGNTAQYTGANSVEFSSSTLASLNNTSLPDIINAVLILVSA